MSGTLPSLDLGTLQLTYQVLALLLTAFCVGGAVLAKGRYGLWFWVASFATLALFQIPAVAVLPAWGKNAGYLLGHLGGMLSSLCVLLGIRAYIGLGPSWKRGLALVLAAATAGAWLMAAGLPPRLSLALSLAVSALLRWQAFTRLLAAFRREGGSPMGFAAGIILLSVISHLMRTGALLSPLGAGYENGFQSDAFGMLGLIVVLVMHGFVILLLVTHALQREVLSLAEHDSLTGLLNRRGMSNRFVRLKQRTLRNRADILNLAVIDIDHFKSINDRFGHAVGDQILYGVAKRLSAISKPDDLCARLGGEEFAVFWIDSSASMAAAMAERIRLTIALQPFKTDEGLLPSTVSIGLCRMNGNESLEDFIDRADQALYVAKQGGRNKVVML